MCNRYPNIELEIAEPLLQEDQCELLITLRRPDVEDEAELAVYNQPVYAQYYPQEKEEQWWVVVGMPKENKLLGIKKVTNFKAVKETKVKMGF